MKFKVSKIAAAVTVGLGISALGMNAAHADRVLFPYVGGSATVASLLSVINRQPTGGSTGINNGQLHYQIFYKAGAAAFDKTAPCVEESFFRKTSANDVVTFDLTGHFGDAQGVLFEPAANQINAKYNGTFAWFKGILDSLPAASKAVRGWVMVDNLGSPATSLDVQNTLFGEAVLIDYVEGAAWGYSAYNPSAGTNAYDFSDANETQGEVIAGGIGYTNNQFRDAVTSSSPTVPFTLYPIASPTTKGDVFTRFFVTPINHDVVNTDLPATDSTRLIPATGSSGRAGQNNLALTTRVSLAVPPAGQALIAYDRDEGPIDGTAAQQVTCVGAVNAEDFFGSIALSVLGEFGGWSGLRVSSPGPLAELKSALTPVWNADNAKRTLNTNEAIVLKLEFNPAATFQGGTFKGAYNNGVWLRRGHRESLNQQVAASSGSQDVVPVLVRDLFMQRGAVNPATGDVFDVGAFYAPASISISQ